MKKLIAVILIGGLFLSSAAYASPVEGDGHAPGNDQLTVIDGVLVASKAHPLGADYNPLPGVTDNKHLLPVAQNAFNDMAAAGSAEAGLSLFVLSGYRSYATQQGLFNRYAARSGAAAANRYSARAGYSEHQTGLACDIGDRRYPGITLEPAFGNTDAGRWLAKNAWRFGFILRYPLGKDGITGYQYEPWHFRYVGKQTAAAMKNYPDATLEDWLGLAPGLGRVVAQPGTAPIFLNDKEISLKGYLINNAHYYKLRDLAEAMEGTTAAFSVDYDATEKLVVLKKKPVEKKSTEKNGKKAKKRNKPVKNTGKRSAQKSQCKISYEGKPLALNSWLIGGHHYVKLRDLALVGYQVDWDDQTKTVILKTTESEEEKPSTPSQEESEPVDKPKLPKPGEIFIPNPPERPKPF